MGNENTPDLSALLQPAAAPQTEQQGEAEDAAAILLLSIKTSLEERDAKIAALTIEQRMLKTRLSTMETMVSYLLEQDPGMKERMKAMADAATPAAPKAVENDKG